MLYHRLKCAIYADLRKVDARSPLGHRYHNMLQIMKNWLIAGEEQKVHLRRSMRRTAREIDELKR